MEWILLIKEDYETNKDWNNKEIFNILIKHINFHLI